MHDSFLIPGKKFESMTEHTTDIARAERFKEIELLKGINFRTHSKKAPSKVRKVRKTFTRARERLRTMEKMFLIIFQLLNYDVVLLVSFHTISHFLVSSIVQSWNFSHNHEKLFRLCICTKNISETFSICCKCSFFNFLDTPIYWPAIIQNIITIYFTKIKTLDTRWTKIFQKIQSKFDRRIG